MVFVAALLDRFVHEHIDARHVEHGVAEAAGTRGAKAAVFVQVGPAHLGTRRVRLWRETSCEHDRARGVARLDQKGIQKYSMNVLTAGVRPKTRFSMADKATLASRPNPLTGYTGCTLRLPALSPVPSPPAGIVARPPARSLTLHFLSSGSASSEATTEYFVYSREK